jgi:hypothetical protein
MIRLVLYNILIDLPLPNIIGIISSMQMSTPWLAWERGEMHAKFRLENLQKHLEDQVIQNNNKHPKETVGVWTGLI